MNNILKELSLPKNKKKHPILFLHGLLYSTVEQKRAVAIYIYIFTVQMQCNKKLQFVSMSNTWF